MSAPVPIATGTLAKTPLPHLLVYLEQKKLSGTLALWPDPVAGEEPKGQDRILLLKGVPVAGRLLEPTTVLRTGLLKLFARERAPYAFYETNLLGDDRVSGRVDPLSLIAESLRERARPEVVNVILQRFGSAKLRMLPGIDLARYELQADERVLIDVLRAEPADAEGLVAMSGLPPERARRLLYLLAITKAIAPFEPAPVQATDPPQPEADTEAGTEPDAKTDGQDEVAAAEASAPVAPEAAVPPVGEGNLHGRLDRLQSIPPPPDDLSDELRQRWLRVITKGRLMENQNYFEMLEVDKEAKSADARTKYYQLAKDWHPDRLPPELQPIREYVGVIFSFMSEAAATLGDENQRGKYVQSVREGGGTPATDRMMQTILDTAMEYERVLVMARRHEYDAALELMIRIMQIVRDDPEYQSMYAWLLMQKFPGADAPLQKMLDSVDKALASHERHERANSLKAQILRRMGRQDEALEYFRLVAEINPRNTEAVREVRVATMRAKQAGGGGPVGKGKGGKGKGGKDAAASVSGLLGKLFNKKD